jgi:hypothetical protein
VDVAFVCVVIVNDRDKGEAPVKRLLKAFDGASGDVLKIKVFSLIFCLGVWAYHEFIKYRSPLSFGDCLVESGFIG